jgi:phage baseplate assembly protein W
MSYNKQIYIKGTKSFNDLDLSFISHPVTKNLVKKTDIESIKQSIKVLLNTHFGEKPFDPTFGTILNRLLFEQNTRFLKDEINDEIRRMLAIYETRVTVVSIDISDTEDENRLNVTIKFYLNGLSEPVTINILMKRVR